MSQTASNGGIPTRGLDVPVDAVFIALFIPLAAAHMTIFQRNRKRGHKFIFNGMLFGFGMSRIVANALRIAWACHDMNADLALAASIFLNAGIVLIYVVNDILAWRLVRSSMPKFGWHPLVRILYRTQLWLVLPMILSLIVTLIVQVKAPSPYRAHVLQIIARVAQTYFFVLAISPILLIAAAVLMHKEQTSDDFGHGSFKIKAAVLLVAALLATIEASYRMATTWQPARSITDPAWYESKAAFYCFNFMLDVLIMAVLLIGRVDLRYHVPDGHKGVGSYSQSGKRHEFDPEMKESHLEQVNSR